MSVLKSIFHRYNKTTSSYDTLHPETEHAQVTDFGQGVIAHLASNVLASTISSITSDSLMAKLVKLVFNATGVQYNIAQNGYVKFGDLFGGLIIQWGELYVVKANTFYSFSFPMSFTTTYEAFVMPRQVTTTGIYAWYAASDNMSKIDVCLNGTQAIGVSVFIIGH